MKLKGMDQLSPHEWMSLAGAILVTGACYAMLIHPSLQDLADVPRCREEYGSVQEQLDQTRNALHRAQSQIDEGKQRLSQMGGGPPPASQKDRQIGRLTALADDCRIKIIQYVPIDTVEHVDHQAFMVEFVGQGKFLDIQQLFGRIESTVPFVDVTNFVISRVQTNETSQCLVTWTCRINGIGSDMKAASELAARSIESGDIPMEVARYEP